MKWAVILLAIVSTTMWAQEAQMKYRDLTPDEQRVIIHKGTEMPFSGEYTNHKAAGLYVCRQCGAPLYRSFDKFDSQCGWPSFDDEIAGAVTRSLDADGHRTEITCATCKGHLGHVFSDEGFTEKNTRHCVNSISLDFIPIEELEIAYFAGGCFWGVEFQLQKLPGVLSTRVGYMGGKKENPTYAEVVDHITGHAEAVEVIFDPRQTDYETITRHFFEIHDPTQLNYQGPDMGENYRSEIFYTSPAQQQTASRLIGILKDKGYDVVTKLTDAAEHPFWEGEVYHQNYYNRRGSIPYCHFYTKRF